MLFFVFRKFPIGSKQNLQEEDMQPLYKGQRACPQRVLCSEVFTVQHSQHTVFTFAEAVH